jgi:cytochrome c oxidase cbb3-type subunit 3
VSEQEQKDNLLEHEYDGIKELDNPLPGWWLASFYGAIVFAFLYVAYYHLGNGPSPQDELAQDMSAVESVRAAGPPAGSSGPAEAALNAAFHDPAKLAFGRKTFEEKCASCHMPHGEGSIGPNLTDNYWIHGQGTLADIAKVVSEGVADKGMPTWGPVLKPEELVAVAAFVHSLKGTNPPNAKAAQGTEVRP